MLRCKYEYEYAIILTIAPPVIAIKPNETINKIVPDKPFYLRIIFGRETSQNVGCFIILSNLQTK